MFDQYGRAMLRAYQEDRGVYQAKTYLHREGGSAAGIRPRPRRNRSSKVRVGLRAILARIVGAVAKPQDQATPLVTPNGRAPTGERADRAAPQVGARVVPQARPAKYGGGLHVRPRSVLPPLKR